MSKQHLILGGSSFVGRRLYQRLGAERAIATFNNNPFDGGVHFDSVSMDLADIVPDPAHIDHAILLLGDTQPDSCVADRERSHLANVVSIKHIIDRLKEWNIRPVFTSSEFIFDGEAGDYTESDEATPILLYGEQKLAVEKYIQDKTDDYAILRLAKIFGDDLDDGTLFSGLVAAAYSETAMRIASDQRFSPVHVDDVCDAILAACEGKLNGVYHVGGPQGLSRLECLHLAINAARRHAKIDVSIETCSIHDFDLPEKRPLDVSMKPDKLVAEMGTRLRTAEESCAIIADAMFAGK